MPATFGVLLAVGVGRYDNDAHAALPRAGDDARAIADRFSRLGLDAVVLTNDEACEEQVRRSLADLPVRAHNHGSALAVVYWTGHATRARDDDPSDLRLYCHDTSADGLTGSLTFTHILHACEQARVDQIMVLLDVCDSGMLLDRLVARSEPVPQCFVTGASAAGQRAWRHIGRQHSVFTAAILKTLDEHDETSWQQDLGSFVTVVVRSSQAGGQSAWGYLDGPPLLARARTSTARLLRGRILDSRLAPIFAAMVVCAVVLGTLAALRSAGVCSPVTWCSRPVAVTLTAPRPHETLGSTTNVSGTVTGDVPADHTMWLAVRIQQFPDRIYPQNPIPKVPFDPFVGIVDSEPPRPAAYGAFTMHVTLGDRSPGSAGSFSIEVIEADQLTSREYARYLAQGPSQLPPGVSTDYCDRSHGAHDPPCAWAGMSTRGLLPDARDDTCPWAGRGGDNQRGIHARVRSHVCVGGSGVG